jgi:hypothetical protein
MEAFDMAELLRQRAAADGPYLEFLRVPDLSLGVLPRARGRTTPHTEPGIRVIGAAAVTLVTKNGR